MTILSIQHSWLFIFGILGNIVSFMVYIAPVPTFYKIVKKKSAEGFQSLPYLAALFSSMLWIYYASFKSDAYLLISINSVGCVIETIYIALYVAYAPRKARVTTLMILLLNFGGFSLIAILSYFLAKGSLRVQVLGWICLTFSVFVFAAPLSIMRQVIRTKSVEFMPFPLSFFLTVNAVMWFFYGLLQNDYYVALPNILGFFFGIVQMALYLIYKNYPEVIPEDQKLPTAGKLEGTAAQSTVEVYAVFTEGKDQDQNLHDKKNKHEESTEDASNQV